MIVATVKTNEFDQLRELIEDAIMDYKNDMGLNLKHICYSSHKKSRIFGEPEEDVYSVVMIFE